MFGRIVSIVVTAAMLGLFFVASVNATQPVPSATYAAVGGKTSIPYGWIDFCSRRPEECDVANLPPRDIRLTAKTWAVLDQINRYVNGAIEPISNLDHWGTLLDHWDYPVDGKGDCKIYALYKRKLLMEAGFPRQALLMTIVRDRDNDGHTILTVKTDHGEFVLDNLADRIRPWDATGYRFIKRQAQNDPNIWLDLGGMRGAAPEVTSKTAPEQSLAIGIASRGRSH